MVPEAQRLRASFVAAMPAYVTGLCAERGYPLDRETVEAIEEATTAMGAALADELEQGFRVQRRSPLEIVRAALEIVSRSLSERGVAPASSGNRGPDGDPYGLAPGSSSDLGPEAHDAHLRWGVAKARAFAGDTAPRVRKPAIAVMASDRADRDVVVSAVAERGMTCVVVHNPGGVESVVDEGGASVAIVDFGHRSSRAAISRFVEHRIPVIVYGDEINDLVETGLRAQGVRHVVDRQRFLADPTALIPVIA